MQAINRRPTTAEVHYRRYHSEQETWDYFVENENITQEQYIRAMERYQRSDEVTFLP